jgi:hypothetical protein
VGESFLFEDRKEVWLMLVGELVGMLVGELVGLFMVEATPRDACVLERCDVSVMRGDG